MKLTVGATLQDGKYLIQEIKPGRLSVTCQAVHTYLDQTVILQTFSEAVQQHSQFGQLQEQFLVKVRELAKQSSSGNHSGKISVLDYFKEGNLPFVVLKSLPKNSLEQASQNSLPQLEDWFPVSLNAPVRVTSDTVTSELSDRATSKLEVESAPELAETVLPNRDYSATQNPAIQTNGLRSTSHEPTKVTVAVGGKRSSSVQAKTHSKTQPKAQIKSQVSSLSKPRLPIALMIVALVGGATGAGMGLAFRLTSTLSGENSSPSRLSLFDREQSFSPEGDWPVQEDEIYAPEPAIEQPLYRTNPSIEYSPQPLPPETTGWTDPYPTYEIPPSPEAITPVEPIDVPPVKTNTKLPCLGIFTYSQLSPCFATVCCFHYALLFNSRIRII